MRSFNRLTSFSKRLTLIRSISFSVSTFRASSSFRLKSRWPSAIILIFRLVSFSSVNWISVISSLNSEASTHLKESGSENGFCAAFQSRYQYHTNANYMLANGIYKTGKTGLNLPFEGYWIIITFNTSNDFGNNSNAWIAQFAISTDTNDKAIYFRRNINYTPTTWESWNRLVAS